MPVTTKIINQMLDYNFGGQSYTVPDTFYLGLSTTVVDSTGSPTVTEPSGGGYARIDLTNDKSTWSNASDAEVYNLISASFVQSSTSWGTILSAFLADGESASAIVWYYHTLSPQLPVVTGTEVSFNIGTITATQS